MPDTRLLKLPNRSLQCWMRSLQAGTGRLGACCAVCRSVAVLHAQFCRQECGVVLTVPPHQQNC